MRNALSESKVDCLLRNDAKVVLWSPHAFCGTCHPPLSHVNRIKSDDDDGSDGDSGDDGDGDDGDKSKGAEKMAQ